MKTRKQGTSLFLALSMVVGMGSASAAAAYNDVNGETPYKEDIDLLSAIEVIDGMTPETFEPSGTLTRAQAAKIVAYLKLGATNAELISAATTQRFDDVPVGEDGHWAAGYIEYCANLGIISGVGENNFDPEGKLTSAAFTKMLLVAVGFEPDANGFTGDSWALNVASTAIENDFYDEDITISATKNASRAEASRLSSIALFFSDEESKSTTYTGYKYDAVNDAFINPIEFDSFIEAYLYAGEDGKVTSEEKTIFSDSLAEDVFGLNYSLGTDSFGRPADVYNADNFDEPLAFTHDAEFTVTSAVSVADMEDMLEDYSFAQGAGAVDAAAVAAMTGNGKTVELYANGKTVTHVVVISPEFVQVDLSTKAESKNEGAYTEYKVTLASGAVSGKLYSTIVDDEVSSVVVNGDIDDNDKVLAYVDLDGKLYLEAVETVTGVLSRISNDNVHTIGDKTYALAAAGTRGTATSSSGTYFIDNFGYFLGTESASVVTSHAYVISQKSANILEGSDIVTQQRTTIVLPDGTVETVVASAAIDAADIGTVMSYTTNDDGEYVFADSTAAKALTAVDAGSADLGNASGLYANNATKFVVVDFEDKDGARVPSGTVTVYTGVNNVPDYVGLTQTFALDTNDPADTIANVVFIGDDTKATVSDDYVYLTGTYSDSATSRIYDTIVKGEASTLSVPRNSSVQVNGGTAGDLSAIVGGMYSEISVSGNAVTITAATSTVKKVENVGNLLFTADAADGTATYSGKSVADDVPVYHIDTTDNTSTVGTAADLVNEETGDVIHVVTSASDNTVVVAIYILNA